MGSFMGDEVEPLDVLLGNIKVQNVFIRFEGLPLGFNELNCLLPGGQCEFKELLPFRVARRILHSEWELFATRKSDYF